MVKGKQQDLGKQWKSILTVLKALKRRWNTFNETILETTRDEVAELPLEGQKAVAKWGRATFYKALPPMIGHLRATGGIEEHLRGMEEEQPKFKEEKKND